MGDKLPTIWPLTPHTRAKHQLLTRYLGAWFPILSRYRGRVVFLDGFAGPGVYAGGEPGSPCLALDVLLGHGHLRRMKHCEFVFIFNEQKKSRFASLVTEVEKVKQKYGGAWPKHVTVMVQNQNFQALADDILAGLEGADLAPTFAFVDPFGYKDTPMSRIKDLLAFDRCELFIYFDANSVNRFATGEAPPAAMTAMYGTDEYQDAPSGPGRMRFLHDLYQRQLKEECGFIYVRSFEMVNESGHTGNYLFYCTRSIIGLKVMKDAMWKVDPGGDYRFSDRNVGQEVILSPNADTAFLMDILAEEFRGREVGMQELEDFVVVETNFAAGHLKKQTLKPMQENGRILPIGQRRRGTFPSDVRVQFL